jgi:hypothetical protein
VGLRQLQGWRWSALVLVLWLASGGGERLVGCCSSPAVPAWRLLGGNFSSAILVRMQRAASNEQQAARQSGSPHLFFSEAWSWRWLATRGEGGRGGDRLLQKLTLMLILVLMPYGEIHLIRGTAACSPHPTHLQQNPLLCALLYHYQPRSAVGVKVYFVSLPGPSPMGNSSCMAVGLWHRCPSPRCRLCQNFLILESLLLLAATSPLPPRLLLISPYHCPSELETEIPRLFQRCRNVQNVQNVQNAISSRRASSSYPPCASTKMGLAAGGCSYVLVAVAPKGSNATVQSRDLLYIADSRCIRRFPSLSKGFEQRGFRARVFCLDFPTAKT